MGALNNWEELGFRIYHIFHFYLWPFPLKWKSDFSSVYLVTSPCKLFPYFVTVLSSATIGFLCFFVIFLHTYIIPHPEFYRITAVVLVIVGGCGFSLVAVITHGALTGHDVVKFVNELLRLTDALLEEYPVPEKSGYKEDISLGFVYAMLIVPITIGAPYVATIIILFTKLEPWYFVLELILPDQVDRTSSQIYMSLLIRCTITFFGTLEFSRFMAFAVGIACVLIDRAVHVFIPTSIPKIHDYRRFVYYHNIMVVVYKLAEPLLHTVVFLSMSGCFWTTVACAWVIVKKSPEEVTEAVYFAFCIAFVPMVLFHLGLLPILCVAASVDTLALKIQVWRTQLIYYKRRSRNTRANMLRAKAMYPLRLKYSLFWYLEEELIPEYLWMLLSRILDVVLTFD